MKVNDLAGKKYGMLKVLRRDKTHFGRSYWECICDCGNLKIIRGSHLLDGSTKSCGCLKLSAKKHGACMCGQRNRLNGIWHTMLNRCLNPNSTGYENYGGRGISVCAEWVESFLNFEEWAHANGYSKERSIDRIDVNRGYYPSNCRWATKEEQANNKRTNVFIEHDGYVKTIKQWSDYLGIPYNTLYMRICHYKWGSEKALLTPIRMVGGALYQEPIS